MITASVTKNINQNGIEIYFDGIPNEETRNLLKEHRWRFHKLKKCWYIYYTAENMNFANRIKNQYTVVSTTKASAKSSVKKKKHKKRKKNLQYISVSREYKSAHVPDVIHTSDIRVDNIHKDREWGSYKAISPNDKRYQKKRSFFS